MFAFPQTHDSSSLSRNVSRWDKQEQKSTKDRCKNKGFCFQTKKCLSSIFNLWLPCVCRYGSV